MRIVGKHTYDRAPRILRWTILDQLEKFGVSKLQFGNALFEATRDHKGSPVICLYCLPVATLILIVLLDGPASRLNGQVIGAWTMLHWARTTESCQTMKASTKTARVKEGSGNVFADLGLRAPQEMLAKAQLASLICQVIATRGLNQTKAAATMGLDQPKISALMRGKLKGFSAERLFRCLNDLGQEVEITIRPTSRTGRRGSTHVLTEAK